MIPPRSGSQEEDRQLILCPMLCPRRTILGIDGLLKQVNNNTMGQTPKVMVDRVRMILRAFLQGLLTQLLEPGSLELVCSESLIARPGRVQKCHTKIGPNRQAVRRSCLRSP